VRGRAGLFEMVGIKFMQSAGWAPEQVCEITGDTLRTIQEHYVTPSKSELAESAREREVV